MKKITKKAKEKAPEAMIGAVEFKSVGICSICGGAIGTNDNINIYSISDCPHYPKL